MKGIRLFEQAVGLEHPWYVERAEFDPETGRLDLRLNFEAGGVFGCGGCGRAPGAVEERATGC